MQIQLQLPLPTHLCRVVSRMLGLISEPGKGLPDCLKIKQSICLGLRPINPIVMQFVENSRMRRGKWRLQRRKWRLQRRKGRLRCRKRLLQLCKRLLQRRKWHFVANGICDLANAICYVANAVCDVAKAACDIANAFYKLCITFTGN